MNPGGLSPPCIDLHLVSVKLGMQIGLPGGEEVGKRNTCRWLFALTGLRGTWRADLPLPLAPVGGAYLAAPGNDLRSVQALGVRPRAGAGPGGTSSQPVNRRRGGALTSQQSEELAIG